MVRTLAISLRPTPEQAKGLLDTMEALNAACNCVSGIAWESRTIRHYALRRLCYYDVRDRFSFRLDLSLRLPDPPVNDPEGFLGVDLGIKNVAVDSDGTPYASGKLRRYRKRCRRLRRRLQALGTHGARRLLAERHKKERRHATHVNHCISKQLARKAAGTGRGVGIEDLTGIRDRTTVRKADREEHSGWAFSQFRTFLEYRCAGAGIPCVAVDARNTSRTCPRCACVDRCNRRSQSEFRCIHCGLEGHADLFAALEVARRATVSWPNYPAWKAPGKGSAVRQGKAVPLQGQRSLTRRARG
jgi:IS605 OrfB family transposase